MRTRTNKSVRVALVSLSLVTAWSAATRPAHAEADSFGIGDGHNGAYTAVAADEVINAYAPLTADIAAGATSIPIGPALGTPGAFAAGDLVMLWRATGLTPAEAPSASATRIDLASNAVENGRVGTFELARVQSATAVGITTTKPLVNPWVKDVTQVVKVPELTTVDVPAGTSVSALAWQTAGAGFAGGILAFLASGTVTIDGQIHADARGFRGGRKDANTDVKLNCAGPDGTEADGFAAKGEGVVSTVFGGSDHGGRGNRANGAGGGNCAENGGGGGGGFGSGGSGGTLIVGGNTSGLGGSGLDYSLLSRFTMGGGGGAGEQKNGVGSGGGAGGGTIFLRARKVAGGGLITANGEAAANAGLFGVESDGAGGGGGGGSILIRAVDTVTCTATQTMGGKGGDTSVAAIGVFGAGGGGGGGRVLIQSKDSGGCPVNVDPGPGGASGHAAAAGPGIVGQPEPVPAPGGNYCFSNPATDPQCADPSPVCDPVTGFCNKCSGPFGGGAPHACTVAVEPVCLPSGACSPCDGDFASTTASACQLSTSPYCFTTGPTSGACGKCSTSADCAGAGHAGPACNATIGACGTACTDDSQCRAGKEWCAQGVCVPKTPNGDHVPDVPPIDGECTVEKGKRVCLSAVCEMDDDLCGLHNGSPCDGVAEECRSKICFPADKRCGRPTGEPCADPGECRSAECTAGVCSGCADDTNCATGKVCDKDKKQCVPGCREAAGKSTCTPPQTCSKKDGTIGQCIVQPSDDGGSQLAAADDAGIAEGGGCACRTSLPASGSPIALLAATVGALLFVRRRRREDDDKKGGA